jgi:signal transduction histidine kinase
MPKIFRSFFTTKKKKGMGLGLSICESIMRAHGGQITVASTLGQGTTFSLHLPVRSGSDAIDA